MIVPMSALLAGSASAADVVCAGTLSGVIDGNVIVTGNCTIEDSTVNGNILQADEGESFNIIIRRSTVYGNVENKGDGYVKVTLGDPLDTAVVNSFNGDIKDEGAGYVYVEVLAGSSFNGNIDEKGDGNLDTLGAGTFNGNTKQEDDGSCYNSIADFRGNACE